MLMSARVPESVEGSYSAAQRAVIPGMWLCHAAGNLGILGLRSFAILVAAFTHVLFWYYLDRATKYRIDIR